MTEPSFMIGDGGEQERMHFWQAGRVLSDADVRDIKNLLDQHDAEDEEHTDSFGQGYQAALKFVGGDALVSAVEASDAAVFDEIVKQALARLDERKNNAAEIARESHERSAGRAALATKDTPL